MTGVVRLQRPKAAIGGPVRIVCRRPGEIFGIETGLLEPVLESLQSLLREGDMNLLLGGRRQRVERDAVGARGKTDDLPFVGEIAGQVGDR
jgi:hypothetical protein